MAPEQRRLRVVLGQWKTPRLDHPSGFRFHDAPPEAVRRALAAVDPFMTTSRPNGQPPAGWLVDLAERLGGLLAGRVGDDEDLPEQLQVDAVCVPAEHAAELARAVDADWPDGGLGEVALDRALAERPVWTGGVHERARLPGSLPMPRPPAAISTSCT